jgi:hypothetical protein
MDERVQPHAPALLSPVHVHAEARVTTYDSGISHTADICNIVGTRSSVIGPNVAVGSVALLRGREVTGSNLALETYYFDRVFLGFRTYVRQNRPLPLPFRSILLTV